MSLICTPDPQTPYKCERKGTVSQTVNFSITFTESKDERVKIGITWNKGGLTCDFPTGNMGQRKSSSNCTVTWSEEGFTSAWNYKPNPQDVINANKLISESVARIREEIDKQNKGRRETSLSYFSSWITTRCSSGCSGRSCGSGGTTGNNCRRLDLGLIRFNCKTADYFEVTTKFQAQYEPKNAVNDILKAVSDLSTDVEGTSADFIYQPIKPGDKTHLPTKLRGSSPCGQDCADRWAGSGGTSVEGVRLLETPNLVPTGRTITRNGSVKITMHYLYCQ